MNATRKATEHKRGSYKPVVSDRGREVLKWLDEFGCELANHGDYWHHWRDVSVVDGRFCDVEIMVSTTTIRALEQRGLTVRSYCSDRYDRITITDAGREYIRGTP